MNVNKLKAHLVAKGCTQKAGIDYTKIFLLVVKFETVRMVMAITTTDDLEIIQFDIKTVATLSMKSARNTIGTRGTLE